ncbi:MAG: 3'-5' exonuclease [Kiritimatiellae bacterium]|nr:3'-5' exonuclease [Kiritimatiellia bacterium]
MRVNAKTLPKLREYARSGRVVVFDTETTGGTRDDEICQIAAVEYVNGVQTRTLSLYICPTCEMNPWAERVHGLSLDFLFEHGIEPEEAMRRFFKFIGEDLLLVAHNSAFDLRMLSQECGKFGLCFSPERVETCDSLALARHALPHLKSHALGYLIDYLGIEGTNSHDALDDTLACAGLFFRLIGET